MKASKFIPYTAALAVAVSLIFGAIYLRSVRAAQREQVPPPVQAPWALNSATIVKKTVKSGFLALATKKPDSEILVAPQVSGTIISMGPREGEPFQPGTILARIDATQINDEIAALQASLDAAVQQEKFLKKELSRQRELLKKGFTTDEKTENARTVYVAAREKVTTLNHQLAQLKTRRSYTVIATDKSGTIAARLAEPGNLATPGKPIYRLSVAGKTRFSIKVPQSVLNKLEVGGLVELNSADNKIDARLTRINQTLDSLSMGSIDVDLAASPFKLPAGARIPARVITGKAEDALSVPLTAIAWSPDGKNGFIVKAVGDGAKVTLQKVPVKVVLSTSGSAAIDGALKAGERVIVAQQAILLRLKSGDKAIIARGMVQ